MSVLLDEDVPVTMDNSLPDQQPLRQFDIGVAILRALGKTLEELAALVPKLERLVADIRPGRGAHILESMRTIGRLELSVVMLNRYEKGWR